jgi:hypothetical protein
MDRGNAATGGRRIGKIALSIAITISISATLGCRPEQEAVASGVRSKCAIHGTPDITRRVSVGGPNPTVVNDTFNAGDAYEVVARGSVDMGAGWSAFGLGTRGSWGPDGNQEEAAPTGGYWPLPNFAKYSLIGRFNQDPAGVRWSELGHSSICVVATTAPQPPNVPGYLYLQANDDFSLTERGTWDVTVLEFHGAP